MYTWCHLQKVRFGEETHFFVKSYARSTDKTNQRLTIEPEGISSVLNYHQII